jgi:hypothetical protein
VSAGAVEPITHELSQFAVTSQCHFLQTGEVFNRVHKSCVTFAILSCVIVKIAVFGEVTQCTSVHIYGRFEGNVLPNFFWSKWREFVPTKRGYVSTGIHDVIHCRRMNYFKFRKLDLSMSHPHKVKLSLHMP